MREILGKSKLGTFTVASNWQLDCVAGIALGRWGLASAGRSGDSAELASGAAVDRPSLRARQWPSA
jgi:hypothetical protein